DGIRDGHVTGVQTCALPISLAPAEDFIISPVPVRGRKRKSARRRCDDDEESRRNPTIVADVNLRIAVEAAHDLIIMELHSGVPRSEERRVGKECRARWYGEK